MKTELLRWDTDGGNGMTKSREVRRAVGKEAFRRRVVNTVTHNDNECLGGFRNTGVVSS